jgi:hypothetical protein
MSFRNSAGDAGRFILDSSLVFVWHLSILALLHYKVNI